MILQSQLKTKGNQQEIQIIKEYGNLPLVECLAGQINQVFMNLFTNAIDALVEKQNLLAGSAPPPTIKIQTQLVDQKWLMIRIIDNGLGIPENVRPMLFDPFFTTKPVGKGTGLGLSISYQIISKYHQGVLDWTSTLGEGTEFMIKLPLRFSLEAGNHSQIPRTV